MAPSVDYTIHLTKYLIVICEGIIENITFEHCVYESVDVKAYLMLYLISLRKPELSSQRDIKSTVYSIISRYDDTLMHISKCIHIFYHRQQNKCFPPKGVYLPISKLCTLDFSCSATICP